MSFVQKACSQGVLRPFQVLVRMTDEARLSIAAALGIRFRGSEGPEGQAWQILNRDVIGLQARTHWLGEMLSPFSRNNNWWEIVSRSAKWLRIPFYAGCSERELEREIFERVAERTIDALSAEEIRKLDRQIDLAPQLQDALLSAGVSRDGIRMFFLGRSNVAAMAPSSPFPSVSAGLAAVKERLRNVIPEWFSLRSAKKIFRGGSGLLAATVCSVYLHDLIEESLDEFRFIRG